MIRINLLPQEQSSGRAGKAPKTGGGLPVTQNPTVLIAAVLTIVYLVLIGVGGFLYMGFAKTKAEVVALEGKKNRIVDEIKKIESEYNELRVAIRVMNEQRQVLEALDPEDRLFWSEKLNILPSYVPDGVFLTRINVTENVREVETDDSKKAQARWVKGGKKGTQPKKVTRPIITQRIQLNGVSYVPEGGSQDRLRLIIDFHNTLMEEKVTLQFSGEEVSFMDRMKPNINFDEFQDGKVAGRDITKFTFYMTSAQPKKPTEDAAN